MRYHIENFETLTDGLQEKGRILLENAAAEASLTVRLFGPLDVQVNGEPLPRLRSRKGLWLLTLLILRRGRQVERSWLAGTLWPESSEQQALANLRLTLTDLRKALGPEANRLRTPTTHTLLLDVTGAFVDLCLFDTALATRTNEALQQAVSLYRGGLLEGCMEEWAIVERADREDAYILALETLAEEARVRCDWQATAESLRRVVRLDPLRETAQRGLFEALFCTGEASAAATVYREFRLHLHQEMKAAPSADTAALFQRLQQQQPQRPPGLSVSPRRPPYFLSLPTQTTTLIGRETALQEIVALLNDHGLVTLTGSAGIGKTRLAIGVAYHMVDTYPDGIAFVDLAVVQSSEGMDRAVSEVLGIREEGQRALRDTLRDRLQNRRLLLILDNCEHLIDACARLTTELLATNSALRVLATSRQSLNAVGERTWAVPPLSLPTTHWRTTGSPDPISALLTFDAIQLFCQRALAVYPAFQITSQNGDRLAQLCRMLEGIPLAIELAAAWVRLLPIPQIAERMQDRLAMLKGDRHLGASRQQTLRAMLTWSYDLLSEAEQSLLCHLSVFVGGWALEAAEAIGTVAEQENSDVLSLLASLVDKSLVLYREIGEQARYRLLETTRQFAAEKLCERTAWEPAQLGHRKYFVSLAYEAGEALAGSKRLLWMSQMERDYDNLQSALERSLSDADAVDDSLVLAGILSHLWDRRGYYTHGRSLLHLALDRAETLEPTWAKGMALEGAAMLAFYQSDLASAHAYYERTLRLWKHRNDPRGMAEALRGLGSVAVFRADYSSTDRFLGQALILDREYGYRHGEMRDLTILGVSAKSNGDHTRAKELLEEALGIAVELADPAQQGRILHNLGNVAREQRRYAEANSFYERSLTIHRGQDNQMWVGTNLFEMGLMMTHRREDQLAEPLLEEALVLSRSSGNQFIEAGCMGILAGLKCRQGDQESTLFLYRRSLLAYNRLGVKREILCLLQDGAFYMMAYSRLRGAACLEGAVASLRSHFQISMPAKDLTDIEERLRSIRLDLGKEEFDSAWAEGKCWTLEQAVAFALEETVLVLKEE